MWNVYLLIFLFSLILKKRKSGDYISNSLIFRKFNIRDICISFILAQLLTKAHVHKKIEIFSTVSLLRKLVWRKKKIDYAYNSLIFLKFLNDILNFFFSLCKFVTSRSSQNEDFFFIFFAQILLKRNNAYKYICVFSFYFYFSHF